jgi:hypothetical protein
MTPTELLIQPRASSVLALKAALGARDGNTADH